MNMLFFISTVLTTVGAITAMTRRGSIQCILSLTVSFVGIAGLYLTLGVQFVGLTQILIYIGAVAILAAFALMMIPEETPRNTPRARTFPIGSGAIGALVFGAFIDAILHSQFAAPAINMPPEVSVHQFGVELLKGFSVPLEVVGILLTGALVGAVIVALPSSAEGA